MVGTLTFPLPEYSQSFQEAIRAADLWSVINELDKTVLRPVTKYGAGTTAKIKYYNEIRDKLWELLDDYSVSEQF